MLAVQSWRDGRTLEMIMLSPDLTGRDSDCDQIGLDGQPTAWL